MKDRKIAVIINILSLVAALILNFLAVNLPLNGLTPREISDQFDIYFVPAGYVFSIWSIIYLGLIAYAVYQALPQNRKNERMAKTDLWFAVSNIANALWLVGFHYQVFVFSLLMMVILLVCLIKIFETFKVGRTNETRTWKLAVEIPFGIYLGWITVATIANVTQVLDYYNWNGFGISEEVWFVIMIVVAVVLSSLMSFRRRAFEYTLVLIWAFVGIAVKFPDVPVVNYASWGGAIAVGVIAMLAFSLKPAKK
jgi:benzodiazapine receptor